MARPPDDEPGAETPEPRSRLSAPPPVDPEIDPSGGRGPSDRYQARHMLGKGAMGEVVLCRDRRIGRDVAMKVIAPRNRDNRQAHARFLREARVQGQLEHPAIVPVYDLGVDADGAEFFTMKCLRGETLAQIVAGLAGGDAAMAEKYPRRRLLSAVAAACLAVDFAHSRGVLHRDLKPANVMLGPWGEVYVLDWGIAKIGAGGRPGAPLQGIDAPDSDDVHTAVGRALGTWGYMSPEQARGRVDELDGRADVYALGAILFEVLALQPLHRKDVWNAMLMATVQGVSARASERARGDDVPPELDAICVKATQLDRADRHATARELHDALERFLEGDRDVEARRQMTAAHARAAAEAQDRAAAGGEGAEAALRSALYEVGRALALEPENREAMALLGKILRDSPRDVPAEVTADLDAHTLARHREQLALAIRADAGGLALMVPLVLWMGVRSWRLLIATVALTVAASAMKLVASRAGALPRLYAAAYVSYVFNVLALVCIGRGFGPLFFTPTLLTAFTFAYCMTHRGAFRAAIIGTGAAALLGAVAVELSGLVAPSYAFHEGAMTILPRAVTLSASPTLTALAVGSVFMVVVPGVLMGRMQRALREAEQRSFLQAWHLRQLLPDEAKGTGAKPDDGGGAAGAAGSVGGDAARPG